MKNDRKKIAIVSIQYAWFPCEPGPSRFFYIASVFEKAGYDVEIVTGSFQHFKKEKRNLELIRQQNYPFKITFIEVPTYKRNIDLRRIYSHQIASARVKKYFKKNGKKYDAVYCSVPPNGVAASLSKYCRSKNIPFIVDVEDLWPEAMSMILKKTRINRMLLAPIYKLAENVYKNADAIVGTSHEYTKRALKNQTRTILNKTVYVGCDLDVFDNGVQKFANEIYKKEGEYWVTYAGSIGTSYDIKTLVEVGKKLIDRDKKNIMIKILGTGPLKDELERLSQKWECSNVEFCGYIEYSKMAAVLSKSDILINSFRKGAPQSIVNKVGDYLAAGRPMINTLESVEFCELVNKYRVGINIEAENTDGLFNAIIKILEDSALYKELSNNARMVAEKYFDRKASYLEIVKLVDETIEFKGEKKS